MVRVQDDKGGIALQSFTLDVALPDTAPVITTSTLPGPAKAGSPYRARIGAQDAEGDALTFSLDSGPAGLTIDPDTGLISWTPTSSQVGAQHLVVAVSDGHGATTQSATEELRNTAASPAAITAKTMATR